MRFSSVLLAFVVLSLSTVTLPAATTSAADAAELNAGAMTLTGTRNGDGTWTLGGAVPSALPGTVVVITGLPGSESLIFVVGLDGSFSFQVSLPGNGSITATASIGGVPVDSATWDY